MKNKYSKNLKDIDILIAFYDNVKNGNGSIDNNILPMSESYKDNIKRLEKRIKMYLPDNQMELFI